MLVIQNQHVFFSLLALTLTLALDGPAQHPDSCAFPYSAKNCLSPIKIAACVVVCACVVLYSYGKQGKGNTSGAEFSELTEKVTQVAIEAANDGLSQGEMSGTKSKYTRVQEDQM